VHRQPPRLLPVSCRLLLCCSALPTIPAGLLCRRGPWTAWPAPDGHSRAAVGHQRRPEQAPAADRCLRRGRCWWRWRPGPCTLPLTPGFVVCGDTPCGCSMLLCTSLFSKSKQSRDPNAGQCKPNEAKRLGELLRMTSPNLPTKLHGAFCSPYFPLTAAFIMNLRPLWPALGSSASMLGSEGASAAPTCRIHAPPLCPQAHCTTPHKALSARPSSHPVHSIVFLPSRSVFCMCTGYRRLGLPPVRSIPFPLANQANPLLVVVSFLLQLLSAFYCCATCVQFCNHSIYITRCHACQTGATRGAVATP
jgi:hypothetical protein